MTRERFADLVWDYLYDLLETDGPEGRVAFEQKLEEDPACRDLLATAKKQKALLATAAKQAAPLEFKAPLQRVELRKPAKEVAAARGSWRWAVAAGLLCVVGLGAVPATVGHLSLSREMARHGDEVASLRGKIAEGRQQRESYLAAVQQADLAVRQASMRQAQTLQHLRAKVNESFVYLTVARPAVYEAGAPYTLLVSSRDFNDRPVPAQLEIKVFSVDQPAAPAVPADRIVTKETQPGTYQVSLPPDLDPKKHPELAVEIQAKTPLGLSEKVAERLKLFSSFHVTHLTTDKPMYQPGQTVYYRSLTLERFSLKPIGEPMTLRFLLTDGAGNKVHEEVKNSVLVDDQSGKPILGPGGRPIHAVGCGAFTLSPDAAGGEYTLTVSEANNRFPPEQRKFIVNAYQPPRLRKELEWSQKSFGPGDEATAACKVTAAEGGKPLAGQPVEATLNIDGKTYGADGKPSSEPMKLTTDSQGHVNIRFTLPKEVDRGISSLTVQFTDGANRETLVRPVPLVLNKIFLGLFPEGGDLVAGVPNRVYFHARTNLDQPAELKGQLVDDAGKVVADLATFGNPAEPGANQGVGVFSFVPKPGVKYAIKVATPSGALPVGSLPEVKTSGVALSIPEGVGTAGGPIQVSLTNVGEARQLLVGAYCRGRTLDQRSIRLDADQTAAVALATQANIGGVYRITVFEEMVEAGRRRLLPLAERLVYRASAKRLDVNLKTLREKYIPGERVGLQVETLAEDKRPTPSIVMLAVVDKNILTLADEKTARAMPTHFLLTSEVRKPDELEHADFLLTNHPDAPKALDLLLGTQGWRRFAEQDPEAFRKKEPAAAPELLARQGQEISPEMRSNYEAVARRLETQLATEAALAKAPLLKEETQAREKLEKARLDLSAFENGKLWGMVVNSENLLRMAESRLAETKEQLREFWFRTLPMGALVLGVLLAMGAWMYFSPSLAQLGWRVGVVALLVVGAGVVWFASVGSPKEAAEMASAKVEEAPQAARQGDLRFGGDPAREERTARPAVPAPAGAEGRAVTLEAPPSPDAALEQAAPVVGDIPAAPPMPPQPLAPPVPVLTPGQHARATRPEVPFAGPTAAQPGNTAASLPDGRADREALQRDRGPKANAGEDKPAGRSGFDVVRVAEARPAAPGGKDALLPATPSAAGVEAGGGRRTALLRPTAPAPPGSRDQAQAKRATGRGMDNSLNRLEAADSVLPTRVRQYAHVRPTGVASTRADFTETLVWQPAIVAPRGVTGVNFELSDSITTFEALACAFTDEGRLGAGRLAIESKLPFNLEPKLPVEITATDVVQVPVAVANTLDAKQKVDVQLVVQGLAVEGRVEKKLDVPASGRNRVLFDLTALLSEGDAKLELAGRSESGHSDSVSRKIRVVPDGFPVVGSHSGQLEELVSHDLELPEHWLKGTLRLSGTIYPSPLASLQRGLEGMLREPHGCFEQTSSTSYPNTLILDYLRRTRQSEPAIERKARDLLDRGYERLIGFECYDSSSNRRGYEWFGGLNPPHEALTAYGLLQFTDMAKLRPVDAEMLARTRGYLLGQRDGQGGFRRNPRGLDGFGMAPKAITNAYILWSLTESGIKDGLEKELAALKAASASSSDPYLLALAANCLLNLGQKEEALPLLRRLRELQDAGGRLAGAETSITASGGRDLQIETTALALLAWLKVDPAAEFNPSVQRAIDWISAQRGGYGAFGGTQATVLALRALVAFAEKNHGVQEDGDLLLWANGQQLASVPFKARSAEPVELRIDDAERVLKAGPNKVRLMLTGKGKLPYTLRWTYRTIKPLSPEGCPVRLSTSLAKKNLSEGESVRLTVKLKNTAAQGQGMAVAIIGLPGGLTLPEDFKQLKEHARPRDDDTKPGLIAAWETRGRELILYWRDLAPRQEIEVPVDLIARVPGRYRGPASRAYLYYNGDQKHWIEPLAVEIAPK